MRYGFRVSTGILLSAFIFLVQPVFAGDLPVQLALDEGTGSIAIDSGGMGNDGLLVGDPIYAQDTADGSAFSLQFDRIDDHIDLGTLDATGSLMTLSAWIKPYSFPGNKKDVHIISKSTGNSLSNTIFVLGTIEAGSGVRLRVRLRAGGTTTTLRADPGYDLVPDQWYHTAATYDGATLRLFLDGVEVGSRSFSGSIAQSPTIPVSVGAQPNGGRYFHGLIDDVRILNESLSSLEIQAIAAGIPPGDPPVANPDNYNTNEDNPLEIEASNGVLVNDTDTENDPLTALLISDATNGDISLQAGRIVCFTHRKTISLVLTALSTKRLMAAGCLATQL